MDYDSGSETPSPDEVDSEEERRKKKSKQSMKKKSSSKSSASSNGKKEQEKAKPVSKPKFSVPVTKKSKIESDEGESDEDKPVKEAEKSDSGSDEVDRPTQPKETMPGDSELRKTVKRIVNTVDLKKVTMKNLLEKVFEEYPNVDLEPKRSFIKNYVKELI
jgi:hypothetical protein